MDTDDAVLPDEDVDTRQATLIVVLSTCVLVTVGMYGYVTHTLTRGKSPGPWFPAVNESVASAMVLAVVALGVVAVAATGIAIARRKPLPVLLPVLAAVAATSLVTVELNSILVAVDGSAVSPDVTITETKGSADVATEEVR